MKKILIYSYWRTGSNLLVRTLKHFGNYYDLNEYYSFVHDSWYDLNNSAHVPIDLINSYLQMLTRNTDRVILKCMLKQKKLLTPAVESMYRIKILLHRYEIEKSILSKFIAEARQSWIRTSVVEQPYFNQALDTNHFKNYINICLCDYEKFIDENENIRTHWYFSYEDDLLPFAAEHPIDFYPTNNFVVQNLEEIQGLFFDTSIKRRINDINEWFKSKSSLNKGRTLYDLRDMILVDKDINE